jgi:hypothetical protein
MKGNNVDWSQMSHWRVFDCCSALVRVNSYCHYSVCIICSTLFSYVPLTQMERVYSIMQNTKLPTAFFKADLKIWMESKQVKVWRMASSGMSRHVALVRTYISEELSASIIRVTRIGELGTTFAVTSNRHTLRRNTKWERKQVWNLDWGCREEWV